MSPACKYSTPDCRRSIVNIKKTLRIEKNWTIELIMVVEMFKRSSEADISSENRRHWPSETNKTYWTVQLLGLNQQRTTLCLKKVLPLTCYNLYIHASIATIFGTTVLYFPTSPNLCFCTTWVNRKPGNCVFSLNCMFFHKKTQNTVENITWLLLNHPSLSKRSTVCIRQNLGREHSILLSVTHMLCVNQVCHGVSRCVKDGSCTSSSLE